ncbi:MAG: hypothetical protein IH586_00870 [Anaerolineaceae bacterium]|nr:hypothetical protein [Anaerolineaceae bacterium]
MPAGDKIYDVRFISFFAGIIFLCFAFFANALGIDNDPGWGRGRLFLLLVGLLLSLPAVAVQLFRTGLIPARIRRAMRRAVGSIQGWVQRAVRCYPLTVVLTGLVWAVLVVYGAWITSAGRFPEYPPEGGFYPRLAEALLHGQLSLLEKPDPILLTLPDPYDMIARDESGAKVVWDASLYNGKYYVYWGPVPALILVAAQVIGGQPPSNAAMVCGFFAGLAGVLAGLLHLIRKRFYPRAPGISIPLFLFAAALNLHTLWLVGRPAVYEASIISGQFFLFLGLLMWLISLESERRGWLVLAGLSWGLAAGSRNTLVISIGVYTAFALLHLWRANGWKLNGLPWGKLAALLIPLFLCGLALMVYNFARFGSLIETGQRYQLSLAVNPKNYFSPAYIPTNLYMWLFYRFDLAETFPFFPFRITYNLQFPFWAVRPPFKMFDREFYGLLPSAPVTWLLALALPLLAGALWRRRRKPAASRSQVTTASHSHKNPASGISAPDNRLPASRLELAGMIGLAGFLQFMVLMSFFYAATRYGGDFTLPGVLIAALVTWETDAKMIQHPRLRSAFWSIAAVLVMSTALIGVFGAFTVPEGLLRKNNPALYRAVAKQWSEVGGYVVGFIRLASKAIRH